MGPCSARNYSFLAGTDYYSGIESMAVVLEFSKVESQMVKGAGGEGSLVKAAVEVLHFRVQDWENLVEGGKQERKLEMGIFSRPPLSARLLT